MVSGYSLFPGIVQSFFIFELLIYPQVISIIDMIAQISTVIDMIAQISTVQLK